MQPWQWRKRKGAGLSARSLQLSCLWKAADKYYFIALEEAAGSPDSIKRNKPPRRVYNPGYLEAYFTPLDVWHVELLIKIDNRQVLKLDFLRHSVPT